MTGDAEHLSLYTSKQNSHRQQLQESKDLFLSLRILAEVEQQVAKLSLERSCPGVTRCSLTADRFLETWE